MSRATSTGPLRLGASTIRHWRTTTFLFIVSEHWHGRKRGVPAFRDRRNDEEKDTGWGHTESGTDLTVTEITAASKGWATASLSRTFSALDDFEVSWDFSWDSAGSNRAMQGLYLRLLDGDGRNVASFGYCDAWLTEARTRYVSVAGSGRHYRPWEKLPLAGPGVPGDYPDRRSSRGAVGWAATLD